VIPLLLGLGIFAWAAKLYADVYRQAPKNSKEIFIIGKQWMWHLQHMNGIREMNELHVPVGTPIKLTMISQDVIHSFYLPAMRIKRDVIPGRYTTVWFQPTKVGRYRLLCTEYCGTQHSLMGGWIYVMEKDDFERWYRTGGETAGSAGAGNAGGPGQGGGLAVAGAQLFQSNGCTNCHAAPGAIARAPTLVGIYGKKQPLDNGRSVVADDAYIRESILYPKAKVVKGYQSIMPPYQGLLTEEQVLQLTAYIERWAIRKARPPRSCSRATRSLVIARAA
jgi:cytochrome c oxidase subunit 2